MMFFRAGEAIVAKASSQGDLLRYLQKNSWNYKAFDYFEVKWFFAQTKEKLLHAVFSLDRLKFKYEQNQWHIVDINLNQFGAMILTPWHEDIETGKFLDRNASHDQLLEAFWIHAQLMESFMGLKFFAPYQEMIDERWCPFEHFIAVKDWI